MRAARCGQVQDTGRETLLPGLKPSGRNRSCLKPRSEALQQLCSGPQGHRGGVAQHLARLQPVGGTSLPSACHLLLSTPVARAAPGQRAQTPATRASQGTRRKDRGQRGFPGLFSPLAEKFFEINNVGVVRGAPASGHLLKDTRSVNSGDPAGRGLGGRI